MKVFLASDHGGFSLKKSLKPWLIAGGIEVIDGGTNSEEMVNSSVFARVGAEAVLSKEVDRAILICGTGIAMSMQANRFKGIRAAVVGSSTTFARLCREHNDANVLCLAGRFCGFRKAKKIVKLFLETECLGGRYETRNKMLDE